MKSPRLDLPAWCAIAVFLCAPVVTGSAWSAVTISIATYNPNNGRLVVEGSADTGSPLLQVTVFNTYDAGQALGSDVPRNNGQWRVTQNMLSQIPCRVTALQGGASAERDVDGAPPDCAPQPPGNTPPTAIDDDYDTIIDTPLNVAAPGVLGNDSDPDAGDMLAVADPRVNDATSQGGSVTLNADGSFAYDPPGGFTGDDTFTYTATDSTDVSGPATVTITVGDLPPPQVFAPQTDFKILMNYELGMHCTGFEFAYCCVLPVYNSIIAQVVKPNKPSGGGNPSNGNQFPVLLEGDPNTGLDALGRETVVRDKELDGNGNFRKYVVKYWHEAQPRNDGNGKPQLSRLISAAEGNSLLSWNTVFDSAAVAGGHLQYGSYNGAEEVIQGDSDFTDPSDNYQNAIWNHLYIYNGLEGEFACAAPVASQGDRCSADADCDTSAGSADGVCDITSLEVDKIRLGVDGHVVYPPDCGPALHPLGPVTQGGDAASPPVANDCGGFSNGNVLTFSGDRGTVVYTQMKVLENLPVTLTSPRLWEALGLSLTPFEDGIGFFADPGLVDEDSVRPFVVMKAQLFEYDGANNDIPVLDGNGDPVVGFGTAPIDIPNCERCHSNPPDGTLIPNSAAEGGGNLVVMNSPNNDPAQYSLVNAEYAFWNAYYAIDTAMGDSDWYSRLKSAAISILSGHDTQHGTSFTSNYPGCGSLMDPTDTTGCGATPQNTRLGHESVICQRCHADNVIAVVKSADCGAGNELGTHPCTAGTLIKPITEAVHNNHRSISNGGTIIFADALGRDGGCQGCHPAHRSSGDMLGYPITLGGGNLYAGGDNRDANGGCFVGRDVHSNPGKDSDGAETPEHLNAIGQWLSTHVFSDQGANGDLGIWCTNCHNQLSQELWKAEDMQDLVHGIGVNNIRAASLQDIADQVAGGNLNQVLSWLDPKNSNPVDHTHAIWDPDPGLCDYVDNELGTVLAGGLPSNSAHDANVATIEVHVGGACSAGYVDGPNLATAFGCTTPATLCGTFDGDGDFSVHVLDFCTTPDCVSTAQGTLSTSLAVPVPFSAATDGRDHWLAGGEPHCADCHAAPYVEQSGNIDAFPPFNYPRKAALMRYSRGHQDITCQGCHESIHGLYPVTPGIDTTSYGQAAALNDDGSHGPLKCGTCHNVDVDGIPTWMENIGYNGQPVGTDFDAAVSWAHTYTEQADVRDYICTNCHEDRRAAISSTDRRWTEHADVGRVSRAAMDKAERLQLGHVAGDPAAEDPLTTLCTSCHMSDRTRHLARHGCTTRWKNHLIEGRAAEPVWEYISRLVTGDTCGW